MKIHPFKAIYPNVELIASPDSFFSTVRNDYTQYYENGFFHQCPDAGYYILEIKTGDKVHTGIVVALDVSDYSKGKIVKHEKTIASSEQDMLKLILQRGAMVKPVLLCHPEVKEITKEIIRLKQKKKPFLALTTKVGHNEYSLYAFSEKDGATLAAIYNSSVPKVYIADGHHRCSTSEKMYKLKGNKKGRDYSLILSAIFPFDQLDILDYNKVVQLPYHLKPTKFIAQVSKVAMLEYVEGPMKPGQKHDLTMCLQDEWYKLTWKKEVLKKYTKLPAVLDAHLLDVEILENILGITDVRTDSRVDHVSGDLGPERVQEKSLASEHHVGFCIYPVQFNELVDVSDSGGTLPPKSTWFEPRMINGLIVKSY